MKLKKCFIKTVLIMISLVMLGNALIIPSFAHGDECEVITETVEPRYVASCPNNSKHYMVGKGTGYVYTGSHSNPGALDFEGQASQCKYCNLVLISEYNPFNYWFNGVLGKYYLCNLNYTAADGLVYGYGGRTGSLYSSMYEDDYFSGFDFK